MMEQKENVSFPSSSEIYFPSTMVSTGNGNNECLSKLGPINEDSHSLNSMKIVCVCPICGYSVQQLSDFEQHMLQCQAKTAITTSSSSISTEKDKTKIFTAVSNGDAVVHKTSAISRSSRKRSSAKSNAFSSESSSFEFHDSSMGVSKSNSSVDSKRKYHCTQCPQVFPWYGDLRNHIQTMHQTPQLSVNVSLSHSSLNSNEQSCSSSSSVTSGSYPDTSISSSTKATINGVEFHPTSLSPQTHSNSQYRCSECKYIAKYKSELSRHERLHKGMKPFCCESCPYKSAWKGDLKRHLEAHHADVFTSEYQVRVFMSKFKNNEGTQQNSEKAESNTCDEVTTSNAVSMADSEDEHMDEEDNSIGSTERKRFCSRTELYESTTPSSPVATVTEMPSLSKVSEKMESSSETLIDQKPTLSASEENYMELIKQWSNQQQLNRTSQLLNPLTNGFNFLPTMPQMAVSDLPVSMAPPAPSLPAGGPLNLFGSLVNGGANLPPSIPDIMNTVAWKNVLLQSSAPVPSATPADNALSSLPLSQLSLLMNLMALYQTNPSSSNATKAPWLLLLQYLSNALNTQTSNNSHQQNFISQQVAATVPLSSASTCASEPRVSAPLPDAHQNFPNSFPPSSTMLSSSYLDMKTPGLSSILHNSTKLVTEEKAQPPIEFGNSNLCHFVEKMGGLVSATATPTAMSSSLLERASQPLSDDDIKEEYLSAGGSLSPAAGMTGEVTFTPSQSATSTPNSASALSNVIRFSSQSHYQRPGKKNSKSSSNASENYCKPYRCSACGHRSNWKWDINKHIKVAHTTRDDIVTEELSPEEARRTYSAYQASDKNVRTKPQGLSGPSGEGYFRPYQCPVCGQRSNWKWDIKKHIKLNHGDAHADQEVISLDTEFARQTIKEYMQSRKTNNGANIPVNSSSFIRLLPSGDEGSINSKFSLSPSQFVAPIGDLSSSSDLLSNSIIQPIKVDAADVNSKVEQVSPLKEIASTTVSLPPQTATSSEQEHKCSRCNFSSRVPGELTRHMRRHDSETASAVNTILKRNVELDDDVAYNQADEKEEDALHQSSSSAEAFSSLDTKTEDEAPLDLSIKIDQSTPSRGNSVVYSTLHHSSVLPLGIPHGVFNAQSYGAAQPW